MAQRDLQIDWLRAFVAVVDSGSLSAAAPLVHRSQPAVSMKLQKLEEAVGCTLVSRTPRMMKVTPAGIELLAHARRILAAHSEALGALSKPVLSGRVRLGVPDDYAERYLTPVLRRFCGQFPSVQIELHCEQSTSLIPRTVAGELDISLVSRDRASRTRVLFQEPLAWVGSPEHELWHLDPLPLAAYEATSMATIAALAALHTIRRRHQIVSNSSSLAGHITAVKSGIAIAVLTRCSVPDGALILGERHGLPPLASMQVGILRSKAARGRPAVDALHAEMERTISTVVSGRA